MLLDHVTRILTLVIQDLWIISLELNKFWWKRMQTTGNNMEKMNSKKLSIFNQTLTLPRTSSSSLVMG